MPQLRPAECSRSSNRISSISKAASTFSISTVALMLPAGRPSCTCTPTVSARFMNSQKRKKLLHYLKKVSKPNRTFCWVHRKILFQSLASRKLSTWWGTLEFTPFHSRSWVCFCCTLQKVWDCSAFLLFSNQKLRSWIRITFLLLPFAGLNTKPEFTWKLHLWLTSPAGTLKAGCS